MCLIRLLMCFVCSFGLLLAIIVSYSLQNVTDCDLFVNTFSKALVKSKNDMTMPETDKNKIRNSQSK